jgi:hypothetical protein
MIKKSKQDKPYYGKQIAARRVELGISLRDIEDMTDGVIYVSKLTRLENGRIKPKDMSATDISLLAHTLNWSIDKLTEVLGIDMQGFVTQKEVVVIRKYKGIKELLNTQKGESMPSDYHAISIPPFMIQNQDPDQIMAYQVEDNVFVEEGTTVNKKYDLYLSRNIKDARPNDLLVSVISDETGEIIGVLRYSGKNDDVVLRRCNDKKPLVLHSGMKETKIGIVVYQGVNPRSQLI